MLSTDSNASAVEAFPVLLNSVAASTSQPAGTHNAVEISNLNFARSDSASCPISQIDVVEDCIPSKKKPTSCPKLASQAVTDGPLHTADNEQPDADEQADSFVPECLLPGKVHKKELPGTRQLSFESTKLVRCGPYSTVSIVCIVGWFR